MFLLCFHEWFDHGNGKHLALLVSPEQTSINRLPSNFDISWYMAIVTMYPSKNMLWKKVWYFFLICFREKNLMNEDPVLTATANL